MADESSDAAAVPAWTTSILHGAGGLFPPRLLDLNRASRWCLCTSAAAVRSIRRGGPPWRGAGPFFPKHFPAYAFRFFSCHSWLLDETTAASGWSILQYFIFQQRFQIVGRTASNAAARYVLRWDIQPDEIAAFIPQNRFQSQLKTQLLSQQQFYEATGILAR